MFSKNRLTNIVIWLTIICVTGFTIGFSMIYARIDGYVESSRSWESKLSTMEDENAGTITGVDEISIKTSSTDVNILKSDNDEVRAVLSGFAGGAVVSSEYDLTTTRNKGEDGDSIYIKVEGSTFIVMGASYVKLDVYIPEEYANKLNITTSSGSIEIGSFDLAQAVLRGSSGSIKVEGLKAGALDVKTSSGAITMDNAAASRLKAGAESGSLKFEDITVTEDIDAQTSSGGIRIYFDEFRGNGYIKTSSGSCRVDFPDDASLALNASSSSGSIRCDLPKAASYLEDHNIDVDINGGKYPVEIKTSSGSIRIE